MNKLMLKAAALLLTMLWMPTASALSCRIDSASAVNFGSFIPLTGSAVDSTSGLITVSCDLVTVLYTIALSQGGSGTYFPRRMASGGNHLDYNLYRDASYGQIWGNGSGGSSYTVTGSFGGLFGGTRNHTVYGRIPLTTQRGAVVGTYSDTITVTVTFL